MVFGLPFGSGFDYPPEYRAGIGHALAHAHARTLTPVACPKAGQGLPS